MDVYIYVYITWIDCNVGIRHEPEVETLTTIVQYKFIAHRYMYNGKKKKLFIYTFVISALCFRILNII